MDEWSDVSRWVAGWLCLLAVGCSNHVAAMPLRAEDRALVWEGDGGGVAAGVLDRCGAEHGRCDASARLLADTSRWPDASASMTVDDLAFLMQSPAMLEVDVDRRHALRERLGARHVLVGERAAAPVLGQFFLSPVIAIPAPGSVVWFTFPIRLSADPDAARAGLLLRLVDLETGALVAESVEVLRDDAEEARFEGDTLRKGLGRMSVPLGTGRGS